MVKYSIVKQDLEMKIKNMCNDVKYLCCGILLHYLHAHSAGDDGSIDCDVPVCGKHLFDMEQSNLHPLL